MAEIYLVRHAETQADPTLPPASWELTPEGHAAALSLKGVLPEIVFTSPEPKAVQTARHLTDLPVVLVEEFREHRPESGEWLSKDEFAASVERYFRKSDDRVWGDSRSETAMRFKRGLNQVIAEIGDERRCTIVSHGRILCSFMGELAGSSGYEFWKRLSMPAVMKLEVRGDEMQIDLDPLSPRSTQSLL